MFEIKRSVTIINFHYTHNFIEGYIREVWSIIITIKSYTIESTYLRLLACASVVKIYVYYG